jgi:hypothetical protein
MSLAGRAGKERSVATHKVDKTPHEQRPRRDVSPKTKSKVKPSKSTEDLAILADSATAHRIFILATPYPMLPAEEQQ